MADPGTGQTLDWLIEVPPRLLGETATAFIARAFCEAQPFYVVADYHPPQPGSRGASFQGLCHRPTCGSPGMETE